MDTMDVTNAVCDRYGLSPEAVTLGNMASECELWAASSVTPLWEKPQLRARADSYRAQQYELLTSAEAIASVDHALLEREALHPHKYIPDPDGSLHRSGLRFTDILILAVIYAVIVGGTAAALYWFIARF